MSFLTWIFSNKMFIILCSIVLIIFIAILNFLEKRIRKTIFTAKNNRKRFYKQAVKDLEDSNEKPWKRLEKINNLAREFFREAFDIPYNMEYNEIMEEFRRKASKEGISFCRLISEMNYSGKEIEEEKLVSLIKLLEKLVERSKIPEHINFPKENESKKIQNQIN